MISSSVAPRGFSIIKFLLTLVLLAGLLLAAGWWWSRRPLALPAGTSAVDIVVPQKATVRSVAQLVRDAGVAVRPELLSWYFRFSGKSSKLKAGSYELMAGDTPQILLDKLFEGKQSLRSVTIVDGWNIRQVRAAIADADDLKPSTQAMSDADLMSALGKPGVHPEGRFLPDTYSYAKGSSDVVVLKMAATALDKQLASAWEGRSSETMLKSATEALILASIIEKETGVPADRPEIGGVFNNRLRIGMRLQTDPTVIYGMGDTYKGKIYRSSLDTDTPYNTYTRAGLPPTPIAMPGKAALLAATQPANTKALYFVARGDGSSEFSPTLDAHNRAVNKYIRGQ